MGEGQGQERTQLTDDPDGRAAQLRAEIEDAREDLGDTAAELAAKTDVKARAQERVEEIKHTGAERLRANPVPAIAVGALIAGFLLVRLWRRRS